MCRYYVEDSDSRLILATEELASRLHPLKIELLNYDVQVLCGGQWLWPHPRYRRAGRQAPPTQ